MESRQVACIILFEHLLRLLGSGTGLTSDILADIRSIGSLTNNSLEGTPALLGSRRSALVSKLGIDASSELADGLLDKAALRNAGAEEDSVDNEQDPGAPLEEERRSKDAEPQENLEEGNKRHGAIIVFLDKLADSVRGG